MIKVDYCIKLHRWSVLKPSGRFMISLKIISKTIINLESITRCHAKNGWSNNLMVGVNLRFGVSKHVFLPIQLALVF